MADEEFCSGCPEKNTCSNTYEQLGKFQGPSVFFRSVAAFLVPILLFAISLGVMDRLLMEPVSDKNIRTLICVIFGVLVCFVYLFILKLLSRFTKR